MSRIKRQYYVFYNKKANIWQKSEHKPMADVALQWYGPFTKFEADYRIDNLNFQLARGDRRNVPTFL